MSESNASAGYEEPPPPERADEAQAAAAPLAESLTEAAGEPSKEPANEPLPTDFGSMLRAAREAAGMNVPTLAMRLRLHVRQIEALERSDLSALPSVIYVRGFLRSCARELHIDAAPLLASLDSQAGVQAGVEPSPAPASFHLARLGDGSRPIMFLVLAGIVLAGLVGIWSQRRAETPPPAVIEPPPPSPALAPEAAEPAPAPGAPASAPAPTPAPAAPARIEPRVQGTARRGVAAAPEPVPAAPVIAQAEPAPAVAPPPEAIAAPPADALVLHVRETSWVEVVQANGASVFSQICLPGSVHTIHGVAPLRVVIGNAMAVDAQYRGQDVDLVQRANANGVARFSLP
jgi:cytoskeleton protein RodZ